MFFLPFKYHSKASITAYIRYCRYNNNRKTINLTKKKKKKLKAYVYRAITMYA